MNPVKALTSNVRLFVAGDEGRVGNKTNFSVILWERYQCPSYSRAGGHRSYFHGSLQD